MAAWEKELEEQLMEAGNRLLSPPSSVDDLLPLLDKIEICLARVEQSPSESMQKALSPSIRALVTNELLRHSNLDVKVAVASCISEITRITAPEAPYDDDKMKEVFQLIVSSFEGLNDKSCRSYNKRASILETVAKVRSCVVMLDLECDALLLEMFHHFLKSIRDYHPENVFSSMETIMTLVLEESEEVSLTLVSSILSCLKRDRKDIATVAKKLGEKVLENCAAKLKPYLIPAVKSLGSSLDDYSEVVANICQGMSAVDPKDVNASSMNMADGGDWRKTSSEVAVEGTKEAPAKTASEEAPQTRSPKSSIMSNGTLQKCIDESSVGKDPIKGQEHDDHTKSKTAEELSKEKTVVAEKRVSVVKSQSKPEKINKQKGRKHNSFRSPSESSGNPADSHKETEKMLDHCEGETKEVESSPHVDQAADMAVPLKNEKEISVPLPLPLPSGTVPDESQTKKARQRRNLIQEEAPSKTPEVTGISQSRSHKRSGRKAQADKDQSAPGPAEVSKKEDGTTSDLDTKSMEQVRKKVVAVTNEQENKKRRVKGKAFSGKDLSKSFSKDDGKAAAKLIRDASHQEKTTKVNSKRKRTSGKEQASDAKEYGEDLVGARIKVWWPDDDAFYKGSVDGFDPVEKRHKVLYDDGDVEVLMLKDERWEFTEDEPVCHKEHANDGGSPDMSSEMHKKKKEKGIPDSSSKQGKKSKNGGTLSSKDKAKWSKSGHKQKQDGKVETKSKDDASKNAGRSENVNGGKSRDSKVSNKSAEESLKVAGKSKDDDIDIPKASTKSKSYSPQNVAKPKGKTARSGSKSSANGSGRLKAGSSKMNVEEDAKSPESAKALECVKGRSPNSSKDQKTMTRKKRPRVMF